MRKMIDTSRATPLLFTLCLAVTLGGLLPAPAASAGDEQVSPAAQALARFAGLAGTWEGTNDKGQAVRTTFQVVASGSAVLEHFWMEGGEGEHDMVTLYHLDGESLLLTHYCAARNQPRMRAEFSGATGEEVRFGFVDVTNLSGPQAGHMHHAVYNFSGDDRFTTAWTWREAGEDRFTEVLEMERVAGPQAVAGR